MTKSETTTSISLVLHRFKRCHCHTQQRGFSTQQVLLILLVVFPLGCIALGLILNGVMQRSQTSEATEPQPQATIASKPEPIEAAGDPAPSQVETVQQDAPQAAPAASDTVELGASVTGVPIRLLMQSINTRDRQFRDFQYQLGSSTVAAMANCTDQSWTSYPERQLNRPQSPATERMLSLVCGNTPIANQPAPAAPAASPDLAYPGVAIVFDPPSNVRSSPGGTFLCTVNDKRTIRVGQTQGEWYPTSACGAKGFIHRSQVRF